MKNLLFLLIFVCSSAKAQTNYEKWLFSTYAGATLVASWQSGTDITSFGGGGYWFFKKNLGIGLRYTNANLDASLQENLKHRIPGTSYGDEGYVVFKHVYGRWLQFWDLPMLYRIKHKRHTAMAMLGISYRKDVRGEMEKQADWYRIATEITRHKSIGYAASLSYQFRFTRNFGVSADAVFRSSKDIPNTFSYSLGLFYCINNKRKEKKL